MNYLRDDHNSSSEGRGYYSEKTPSLERVLDTIGVIVAVTQEISNKVKSAYQWAVPYVGKSTLLSPSDPDSQKIKRK